MNIFDEGRVLLIDKPYDWTSFDVVRKMRNLTKTKKIGHAGTLDPLATGLLILCTGKFTKKINEYMAQEKEYTGRIVLGATTPTFDLESIPCNFQSTAHITSPLVEVAAARLTGTILQVPPAYSAVKKDGKRAYELARKGQEVNLEPRSITVSLFETSLNENVVGFRIVCSTGTYIRSLASSLGEELGCGGYLSSLRRTRIGNFSVADAWSMQDAEGRIPAMSGQNG